MPSASKTAKCNPLRSSRAFSGDRLLSEKRCDELIRVLKMPQADADKLYAELIDKQDDERKGLTLAEKITLRCLSARRISTAPRVRHPAFNKKKGAKRARTATLSRRLPKSASPRKRRATRRAVDAPTDIG